MRDIACSNLTRQEHRWIPTAADHRLDSRYPEHEQLPDTLTYVFTNRDDTPTASSPTTIVQCDGKQLGDALTDSSHTGDGYRLHDVFHLAYATVLGWSPVTRSLLRRKRRSNPTTDEIEDGGRAIVVEEGIAVTVFAYAASRDYLRGADHVDNSLLAWIATSSGHLEVGGRTAADWEQAVLTGFRIWHELRRHNGTGTVHADLRRRTMTFTPHVDGASSQHHLSAVSQR
ncbi:hypothetical protein [Lentzea sp. CA-135723]|uniref:hypothetical protein n=1 Tax=Lentzea sp. CA-135723 TaxID=3239950 RepID=UPI003D920484